MEVGAASRHDTEARGTGPVGLRRLVAGLVGLEAVGVVAAGVVVGVETVVADATEPAAAAVEALLAVVVGLGLGLCSFGVWRARRWSRAPVFTWQLLQITLAIPMLGSSGWRPVGLLMLFSAAFVGLMMLGERVIAHREVG